MASGAQIAANRERTTLQTGPRTPAGKAAVAQNSTTHGLSSKNFALLAHEDPEAFRSLLASLEEEHQPETPSQTFLVLELARAQWRIERANTIEAELLKSEGTGDWAAVAASFKTGSSTEQALLRLNRYEQAARRAWHQALNQR